MKPPAYVRLRERLQSCGETWLVTGAAGFIGSALVEELLNLDQRVVGLDDFSTGRRANLEDVRESVGAKRWHAFTLIEGDVTDAAVCRGACAGIDRILHQAALGSVPRSLKDPWTTHQVNVNGFVQVMIAARDAGVRRVVYASSSSVYGDSATLPKVEGAEGEALSPYAASKRINEIYAGIFHRCYGLPVIGLRYFNVFGRRQDPDGVYAAVIPHWIATLLAGSAATIYGDGSTSRDFCYIDNVVQANLLAATTAEDAVLGRTFNIACEQVITLRELYACIAENLPGLSAQLRTTPPHFEPFRPGDIRHSLADISASRRFGYAPQFDVRRGLLETMPWYVRSLIGRSAAGLRQPPV